MKKAILICLGLLIINVAYSQYLGWSLKRINRSIKLDSVCPFVLTYSDGKAVYEFQCEVGLTKMTFYFNKSKRCHGYTVEYHDKFEDRVQDFIKKSFDYIADEDYYENRKSILYYQASAEVRIIHIVEKEFSSD